MKRAVTLGFILLLLFSLMSSVIVLNVKAEENSSFKVLLWGNPQAISSLNVIADNLRKEGFIVEVSSSTADLKIKITSNTYNVIMLYTDRTKGGYDYDIPAETEQLLKDLASSGVGLIGFHDTIFDWANNRVLEEVFGVKSRGFTNRDNTYIVVDKSHSITQGLPDTFWVDDDEILHTEIQADVQVLIKTDYKDMPAVTAREYGNGRVVWINTGHYNPPAITKSDPNIVKLYVNAVRWVSSAEAITPTGCILRVQSHPITGIQISYSGDYSGTETTNFDIGPKNSPFTVTLTAPLTYQDYKFSYWLLDDVNMGQSNSVTVRVDEEKRERTATAIYSRVPSGETLDSIASAYARNGEDYGIFNVKIGDDLYYVILYFEGGVTSISHLTGAVVLNGTNLSPLIASQDYVQNFIVNCSLTLALGKFQIYSSNLDEINFWTDLNEKAKIGYGLLTLEFALVQVLWIVIDFKTLNVADIAARALEVSNFALQQVDTLTKMGGKTEAIQDSIDVILLVKDTYDGLDAMEAVYQAYLAEKWLSSQRIIEYANKRAYSASATFLIETTVDYTFTNDIGGMATTNLELWEYTNALIGVCKHLMRLADLVMNGTASPPEVHSMQLSQILRQSLKLRICSAMTNMYQNIVNRGIFNVWYWLLDAPNSLKKWKSSYESYLEIFKDQVNAYNKFYSTLDMLYQQSVERVQTKEHVSSLKIHQNYEQPTASFLILPVIFRSGKRREDYFENY